MSEINESQGSESLPELQDHSTMSSPPLVVLDTNVWVSRQLLMLNTPLAASLLFALQRREGKIGLPEVIELEIAKVVGTRAVEAARRFDDAADFLETLGFHTVSNPPFDLDSVRTGAVCGLGQLEPFLTRAPLTLAQARGALARVIAEEPPNGPKNQQFKDSLAWEAVVAWASDFQVTFITGDKGFFHKRDYSLGLAPQLLPEANGLGIRVLSPSNLGDFLADLSEGLSSLQEADLERILWTQLLPRLEAAGDRWNFQIQERISTQHAAYLTKRTGVLAVEFKMAFRISLRSQQDLEGSYSIGGSCFYVVDEAEIDNLNVFTETASLDQPEGGLSRGSYLMPVEREDEYIGPRLM